MSDEKQQNAPLIVHEPHPVLRKKAREVEVADILSPRIQKLLALMQETLAGTSDGVGLAAPQIGEPLRIFIVSEEAEEIDRAEKQGWERRQKHDLSAVMEKPYEKRAWKYFIFINPVVKNKSRKMQEGAEGCLSVPGKYATVPRYEKITIQAYNEYGKKITRGASRFLARVMQHELDHLEGVLFVDKATSFIDPART